MGTSEKLNENELLDGMLKGLNLLKDSGVTELVPMVEVFGMQLPVSAIDYSSHKEHPEMARIIFVVGTPPKSKEGT